MFQRDVYYVTLMATALSAACLIAPSAAHRLRFHQGERAWIVESANGLMIAGLVFLAVALGGSVLLITDMMFDGARVWIYIGPVCAAIVIGLWFVRPLVRRPARQVVGTLNGGSCRSPYSRRRKPVPHWVAG